MAHGPCLYEKTFICQTLSSLLSHHSIMRPKVQLTHLDVNYQQEERGKTQARLEELKKPKVIPREKPPANFSFKPMTFDLPPSISFVSKDSPLGFGKFKGIQNRPYFPLHLLLPQTHFWPKILALLVKTLLL